MLPASKTLFAPPADTPGPGAYDVNTSLLNSDKHKHYGFLNKAKRFQSPKHDPLHGEADIDSNENSNPRHSLAPRMHRLDRGEDIQNLKKEAEQWRDMHQRQVNLNEKDRAMLEERIAKLNAQLQSCIKERNTLQSQQTVRDKELADLQHKHMLLRANLDKAESQSLVHSDKVSKVGLLEKKLMELQRQNERLKGLATTEKKMQKERDTLINQVAQLKSRLEEAQNSHNVANEQLTALTVEFGSAREKLRKAESRTQMLALDRATALEEHTLLKEKIQDLETQLQSALTERDDALANHTQASQDAARIESMLRKAEEQNELLKAQQRISADEHAQLRNSLEEKLHTFSSRAAELQQTVSQLEAGNDSLSARLETAEAATLQLRQELAQQKLEWDQERERQDAIMSSLKISNERLEAEIQKLIQQNHEEALAYQTNVHNLQTTLSERVHDIEHLAASIEKLTEDASTLKSDNAELGNALKDRDSNIHELQNDAALLRTERDQHLRTIDELRRDLAQLNDGSSMKDQELCQLRVQASEMRDLIRRLNAESSQQSRMLADKLDEVQSSLNNTQQDLHLKVQETEQLLAQCSQLRSQRDHKDADIQALKAECLSKDALIDKLREDMLRDKQHLQRQLDNAKASLKQFEEVVETKSQNIIRLEKLLLEMEGSLHEMKGAMSSERTRFDNEMRASSSALEKSSQELRHKTAEIENLRASMSRTEVELNRARSELESRQQELLQQLGSAKKKIEETEAKVNQGTADLEEARSESAIKDEIISKLRAEAINARQALEADVEASRLNVINVQHELEKAMTYNEELSTQISALSTNLDVAGRALEECRGELGSSKEINRQQDQEIQRLRQEVQTCRAIIETIRKELADSQLRSADLRGQAESTLRSLETERAKVDKLEEQLTGADRQMREWEQNEKDWVHEREALEAQLRTASDEVQSIETQKKALLQESLASATQVSSLEQQLSSCRTSIAELEAKLTKEVDINERLSCDLRSRDTHIAALTQDLSSTTARLAHTRETLTATKEEMRQLELDFSLKESSLAASQTDLRHTQSRLNQMEIDLDEKGAENKQLRQRVENVSSELLRTRVDAEAQGQKLVESQKLILQYKSDIAELNGSITARDSLVVELENKLRLNDAAAASYRDKIQLEVNNLSTIIAARECDNTRLEGELSAKMTIVDELQAEVSLKSRALEQRIQEISALSAKSQRFESDLATSQDLVKQLNSRETAHLERIHSLSGIISSNNAELAALRAEVAANKASQGDIEVLTRKVAQRDERLLMLENQLEDAQRQLQRAEASLHEASNTQNVIELKMANEVSARDMQIRRLQDDLKSKNTELADIKTQAKSAVTSARKEAAEARKDAAKSNETTEKLCVLERALKEAERRFEGEKADLACRVRQLEQDYEQTEANLVRTRAELIEERREKQEMEENHKSQLELLTLRGQLKKEEVKKLGELNAELFGHTNNKQKIKHVAQLKEKNIELETKTLTLSRECEVNRRKIQSLQRELESYRSIAPLTGHGNGRKVSRAGRAASSQRHSVADISMVIDKIVEEPEDKENVDATYSSGGLSFVIN